MTGEPPSLVPFVAMLICATATGCNSEGTTTPEPTNAASQSLLLDEPTWDEQVAAVRDGLSTEIRVSAIVDGDQLEDLNDGCERLTVLVLDQTEIVDTDLDVLPRLPNLRWIKLTSAVGDAGAASIGNCRSLEIVNLPGAAFTDRSLAAISRLERLELLRFRAPQVTAAGLHELTRFDRLRFLHLIDVPIDAGGLKEVAAVETLESFYLDGDIPASDDDLRALLAARPDLHFHIDQQHLFGDPNAHPHN